MVVANYRSKKDKSISVTVMLFLMDNFQIRSLKLNLFLELDKDRLLKVKKAAPRGSSALCLVP